MCCFPLYCWLYVVTVNGTELYVMPHGFSYLNTKLGNNRNWRVRLRGETQIKTPYFHLEMFSSPRQEADGVDGEVELGDGADEHGAVLLRLALPVEHDRHSLLPKEGTQIAETQVAPS